MHDSLGDRMKQYENAYRFYLPRRTSVIIRVDGRSFSKFTLGCDRPFDSKLIEAMRYAATEVAKDLQGFKLGYVQSDESSFLISDFDALNQEAYFANNLAKIISMTASMMTAHFNQQFEHPKKKLAFFDSRAFIIPDTADVPNYFLWRHRDWKRNSVSMLGRTHFSHLELEYKNVDQVKEKLKEQGVVWDSMEEYLKYGTFILPHEKSQFKYTSIDGGYQEIHNLIQGI